MINKINKEKQSKIYIMKKLLVDFVYPNRCPFCDKVINYNEYFHNDCLEQLDIFDNELCQDNDLITVCFYNEKSRQFIHKAKEDGNGYAVSAAAKLLYERLSEHGTFERIDIITSIPAKKLSLRKRGYCFPKLMAREISELAGLPYNGKLLTSLNNTEQKELSAKERIENMRKAFELGKKSECITGCRILLIDDVRTTGATLDSAKNVLEKAGALEVVKAAFAFTEIINGKI